MYRIFAISSEDHLPPLFFLTVCFIVAPEAVPVANNLPIPDREHFCQRVGMWSRWMRDVQAGSHGLTGL